METITVSTGRRSIVGRAASIEVIDLLPTGRHHLNTFFKFDIGDFMRFLGIKGPIRTAAVHYAWETMRDEVVQRAEAADIEICPFEATVMAINVHDGQFDVRATKEAAVRIIINTMDESKKRLKAGAVELDKALANVGPVLDFDCEDGPTPIYFD